MQKEREMEKEGLTKLIADMRWHSDAETLKEIVENTASVTLLNYPISYKCVLDYKLHVIHYRAIAVKDP